ncbi:hypothetical protein fh0823_13480 [Francisella halioticida]|nr:hypothetical protein fh0823_13480 [Francisella halioticida]
MAGESDLLDKIISEYFNSNTSVEDIDTTDGVRITFVNKDILHLRPSGNAPELRCYTETSSKKVAEELNKYSVFLIEKLG